MLTHDIMLHFVFKTQLNTYERKGKDKYHSNKALLKLRISKKMFKIPPTHSRPCLARDRMGNMKYRSPFSANLL